MGKKEKLILVFEPTYKNLRVVCLKVSVTLRRVSGGLPDPETCPTEELKYVTRILK